MGQRAALVVLDAPWWPCSFAWSSLSIARLSLNEGRRCVILGENDDWQVQHFPCCKLAIPTIALYTSYGNTGHLTKNRWMTTEVNIRWNFHILKLPCERLTLACCDRNLMGFADRMVVAWGKMTVVSSWDILVGPQRLFVHRWGTCIVTCLAVLYRVMDGCAKGYIERPLIWCHCSWLFVVTRIKKGSGSDVGRSR